MKVSWVYKDCNTRTYLASEDAGDILSVMATMEIRKYLITGLEIECDNKGDCQLLLNKLRDFGYTVTDAIYRTKCRIHQF